MSSPLTPGPSNILSNFIVTTISHLPLQFWRVEDSGVMRLKENQTLKYPLQTRTIKSS